MLSKQSENFRSFKYIRILIPLVLLFCFTPVILKAQCITNNEIELTALCIGNGLAVLKGSTPKGGTGNYTYTWEKNTKGNCANKEFVVIAGATGTDYVIPAGRDAASCYRRIVSSGNCKEESNKVNVKLGEIPSVSFSPAAPQASAQHPQGCSQATGSITVTPIQGMQYSINGTQYQQSNMFNNVAPGTYNVTVKNSAGCVSAAASVTINTPASAPTGTIVPAAASICEGKSQLLAITGGTSYQWKRNGVDIASATSASYSATLEGTYTVTIKIGSCNGQASNTAVIKVQACIPIGETKAFVPAAFTPDRNNTNDQLQPYFKNVTELKYFKVFNRWGQMIFQTNIIGKGWDGMLKGMPQPSETYSWMLEYVDNNGKLTRQSGTSILVR